MSDLVHTLAGMECWIDLRNVEVVRHQERDLVCRIDGRQVTVPSYLLKPGSQVWGAGDRGTLVVPRWFAANAGLIR